MSWPFNDQRRFYEGTALEMIAQRTGARIAGVTPISRQAAMQNSVVWACLVLRADLVARMPISVYTTQGGIVRSVAPPPILISPSFDYDIDEWMWSSQFELDSCGNFVGVITAKDGAGRPAQIEPVAGDQWMIRKEKGQVRYYVDNHVVPTADIWHERAYRLAGHPIGLSPIANSAYSLGNWKSASEFAAAWFGNKAVPGGHLKNTARVLKRRQAAAAKESFKSSVQGGDVWVSGSDWEYTPLAAKAADSAFLEVMQSTASDICRFLGVPGDMVDVATSGQSITYANVTQRNLQFLITKLDPAIVKRENRISNRVLSRPQRMKVDTDTLLRMDPASLYTSLKTAIDSRQIAPSEARALMGRNPYTDDQLAEFATLFPAKAPTPAQPAPTDGGQS